MDWDPIVDGLQVSGVGMGMTTVVLIVLALSVRTISWIDSVLTRREQQGVTLDVDSEIRGIDRAVATKESGAVRSQHAKVAAIAVALALAEQTQRSQRAKPTAAAISPTVASDAWLAEGRARQRAKHTSNGTGPAWR